VCAPLEAQFVVFGRVGGVGCQVFGFSCAGIGVLIVFHIVPNMLSVCFHQVLNDYL
jgi:hypothetical protein